MTSMKDKATLVRLPGTIDVSPRIRVEHEGETITRTLARCHDGIGPTDQLKTFFIVLRDADGKLDLKQVDAFDRTAVGIARRGGTMIRWGYISHIEELAAPSTEITRRMETDEIVSSMTVVKLAVEEIHISGQFLGTITKRPRVPGWSYQLNDRVWLDYLNGEEMPRVDTRNEAIVALFKDANAVADRNAEESA